MHDNMIGCIPLKEFVPCQIEQTDNLGPPAVILPDGTRRKARMRGRQFSYWTISYKGSVLQVDIDFESRTGRISTFL